MSHKVVISRIQHRRGLKENLPQPLLPGELGLAVDEGELWIGGDPTIAPWGVRVYDVSSISLAETIVDNHIVDVEFDGTFTQADFNALVTYLTTTPTPSVVLEEADILWDNLSNVMIVADDGVSVLNTVANILLAIQDVSNPTNTKYVSGDALGARAPLLNPLEDFTHIDNPAFDTTEGVFLLGNVAPESNGNQAANAARLINRYNGAGIVTTISNIRVPTAGATVGQLVFRDVGVEDVDPWNNWSADGTFSATNTLDKVTFVSGAGIDIDIDTDNRALRITNTSIAASLNLFSEIEVSDDDTGYTWDEDGTVVASGTADTLTLVSGTGIDIDIDPASNAIIIHSLAASAAYGTLTDGTNDAIAVGNDTFQFRTANDRLGILVTNDDMTFGDNILFTLEESNIDHNALANYVAEEHLDWTVSILGENIHINNIPLSEIYTYVLGVDPNLVVDHSTVEINGADSIDGGGDITATRTLSLVNDAAAPGNDLYYGTNSAGDKGWHSFPAVNDSVYDTFVATETEFLLTPTLETIAAQDETDFDGAGSNGTFVGGDGVGGTAYVVADTITLSDGTVITVDNVDGDGDVTEFTITTASTSVFTTGTTLTQASTSGTGTDFSITTGPSNEAPSSISSLDVSGFEFDIDTASDVIFVEYSLNSGDNTPGANNFTAIGTMKIVANANAETGLATLVDDQVDVRDAAYTGDVDFQALFVAGSPNMVQVQYTNTLTSDVTLRIVIRRWMSY